MCFTHLKSLNKYAPFKALIVQYCCFGRMYKILNVNEVIMENETKYIDLADDLQIFE